VMKILLKELQELKNCLVKQFNLGLRQLIALQPAV
jgi:hypothetical protein